jgi:hypothetical protein
MGVEEDSDQILVEPIFEGDSANAIRTDLKMQGNPKMFIENGGAKNF